MPQILRNMHVLAVPDVKASARYYEEVLGFEIRPVEDEGWRFVKRDDCVLMLGECPDAIHPSELGDHSYFAYFVVDDVDTLYADYQARGATFRNEVADKPWGMREFALQTPDGHRIMFGQDID